MTTEVLIEKLKQAQACIADALILVGKLDNDGAEPMPAEPTPPAPALGGAAQVAPINEQPEAEKEVEKVCKKLKKWARPKCQSQINARILNAFLALERNGNTNITKDDLRAKADIETFDTNFAQMINIAPKNHGKVFDMQNGRVTIWSPVVRCIREYQRVVQKQSPTTR